MVDTRLIKSAQEILCKSRFIARKIHVECEDFHLVMAFGEGSFDLALKIWNSRSDPGEFSFFFDSS